MRKTALMLAVITGLAFAALPAFAGGEKGAAPAAAQVANSTGPGAAEKGASGGKPADGNISLYINARIPLFSPLFQKFPLAVVNKEPITLEDLTQALASSHQEVEQTKSAGKQEMGETKSAGKKDYMEMLGRLINVKLFVSEAETMGLTDMKEVKNLITAYSHGSLRQMLVDQHEKGLKAKKADVDKLYKQNAMQYKLTTILLSKVEDEKRVEKEIKSGVDFAKIVQSHIENGTAQGGIDKDFLTKGDMSPEIASAVAKAKIGVVNKKPVRVGLGFAFFRVDKKQVPEKVDEAKMKEAGDTAYQNARHRSIANYKKELIKKYVKLDKKLYASLNYDKYGEKGFKRCLKDKRRLVFIKGEKPVTVAEFSSMVKAKFYHGVVDALKNHEVNEQKPQVLDEMLYRKLFLKEAIARGLEKSPEYKRKMKEYTDSLLFGLFVGKVIAPDVKVTDADLNAYYEKHKGEYTSPERMRVKSIAFKDGKSAETAMRKLVKGTDFEWMKTNADGRSKKEGEIDTQNAIPLTQMASKMRKSLGGAKAGDYRLMNAEDGAVYVLYVKDVVPPEPAPLYTVKDEISKKIYGEKLNADINDWAAKLRKAYKVKIYLTD